MVAKRTTRFCGKKWYNIQIIAYVNAIVIGRGIDPGSSDQWLFGTIAAKIWN